MLPKPANAEDHLSYADCVRRGQRSFVGISDAHPITMTPQIREIMKRNSEAMEQMMAHAASAVRLTDAPCRQSHIAFKLSRDS